MCHKSRSHVPPEDRDFRRMVPAAALPHPRSVEALMSDLRRLLIVVALTLVACGSTAAQPSSVPVAGPSYAVVRTSTTPTVPVEMLRTREGAPRPAAVPLDRRVCVLRHGTC
jgi:hypothetical protein